MANINKNVDFQDELTEGQSTDKEHQLHDVMHKLFVVSTFHNHAKALNAHENAANKPSLKAKTVSKGALSGS